MTWKQFKIAIGELGVKDDETIREITVEFKDQKRVKLKVLTHPYDRSLYVKNDDSLTTAKRTPDNEE